MAQTDAGPWPARTLRVTIRAPAERVYEFARDVRNLPRWASGLGDDVRKSGEQWIVRTPDGDVELEFAPPNPFGVLDHWVRTRDGHTVHNPMRVVPNGAGSDVLFTLHQRPGMTSGDLDQDAAIVERDLQTLKRILDEA